MSDTLPRIFRGLLVLGGACLLVAIVFWVGFDFGQRRAAAAAQVVAAASGGDVSDLELERERLSEQLAESERQLHLLERAREIDQEATKALTERLKKSEGDQVALSRDLAYLKRMVQDGGKGVVRVTNLQLTPGDTERSYRFAFSVTQLIPGLGPARGNVEFSVRGNRDGKEVTIPLGQLPDADPKSISMDFQHFQGMNGSFALPDGFQPTFVVVAIKPRSGQFLSTSEVLPWQVSE